MKLRNKKTGEIKAFDEVMREAYKWNNYNSLAELNAEWEDYKELKDPYFITEYGEVFPLNVYEDDNSVATVDEYKQIGNYFGSREEAEEAVRKLKAWKRLKDDGLKIRMYEMNGATDRNGCFTGNMSLTLDITRPVYEDVIQLLFGGEE